MTIQNFILLDFFWNTIHNPIIGYIDPGTGSIMLQAIIAGIIGVSITAKLYWHRIKVFLKIKQKHKVNDSADSESEKQE